MNNSRRDFLKEVSLAGLTFGVESASQGKVLLPPWYIHEGTVALSIDDGDPWYLSPNLWAVPGENPEGTAGQPIAGQPAYLWARVSNKGTNRIENATVRYYWANPSVGFDRTTANLVGLSFVSLDPGQTEDVLCITPWVPVLLNNGHECILAEAFHASADPLPTTPSFNVQVDRHVAQRNLAILMATSGSFFFAFTAHNSSRKSQTFTLKAQQADIGQITKVLPRIAPQLVLPQEARISNLGFVLPGCPTTEDLKSATPTMHVQLPPRGQAGYTLVGHLGSGGALVHVTQENEAKETLGGLSVLVLFKEDQHK